MTKTYCDINYRGYRLEIEEARHGGNTVYRSKSRDNLKLFIGWYYQRKEVFSGFVKAVDEIEGVKEENEVYKERVNNKVFEVLYENTLLHIYENKEESTYFAWADEINFVVCGEKDYTSIIEAFRNKVDSKK